MADKKAAEKDSFIVNLLRKLSLAPEARTEAVKPYAGGKIRKFIDLFRASMSHLTVANVLGMLFALPIITLFIVVTTIGFEEFTYILTGVEEAPYLLGSFGIGLSSGSDLVSTKIDMLLTYRLLLTGTAVCMPLLGFSFAGIYHITTKFNWGDSFITKRDKFGNEIPRIAVEFFRGVKLYWKQYLVLLSIYAVFVAGCGNLIITFVEALWLGTANAGHYIGLVIACILGLFSTIILLNMMPLVVTYRTSLVSKFKNSCIFTVSFFAQQLFMVVVIAVPFLLLLVGSIITMLAAIACLVLSLSYIAMISTVYSDTNSERYLVPLYEMSIAPATKGGKKKKKKN
ncbi:MAG: hypothetical protein R3Y23_05885 [Bacillota bacterium]